MSENNAFEIMTEAFREADQDLPLEIRLREAEIIVDSIRGQLAAIKDTETSPEKETVPMNFPA